MGAGFAAGDSSSGDSLLADESVYGRGEWKPAVDSGGGAGVDVRVAAMAGEPGDRAAADAENFCVHAKPAAAWVRVAARFDGEKQGRGRVASAAVARDYTGRAADPGIGGGFGERGGGRGDSY